MTFESDSKFRCKTAIYWFRRDLRVHDNLALSAAMKAAENLVPVYVLSHWKKSHEFTSSVRQEFLCGCLESLSEKIKAAEGRLIFRSGDADSELEKLIKETKAEAIYYHLDPDPFGREMEKKVDRIAKEFGVKVFAFADVTLHRPDEVLSSSNQPYRVYSPYARAWMELKKPAYNVTRIGVMRTPRDIRSLDQPTLDHWGLQPSKVNFVEPGEDAAKKRLARFLKDPVKHYKEGRNFPGEECTSRVSQDLRWGLLSIREVFGKCNEMFDQDLRSGERSSVQKFIRELAWRDFYMHILHFYPEVLDVEFNPKMRNLKWEYSQKKLDLWKSGMTGFPIVDAAIRQLLKTGYMHNRLRMIVAMFLTKDLHLDWREGEKFFMQHLVDGEIANNNGGWQWSAGVGADAAPYFRIQNPWLQSERFDEEGDFIREFVPELAKVSKDRLHKLPANNLALAKDYPLPMVNHAEERLAALEFFKS